MFLPKIIARNIELTPLIILIPVPFIKPVTNTSINNTNNPPEAVNTVNSPNPLNTPINTVPS